MNGYALVPLLSVGAYAVLLAFALRQPRRRERHAFALYLTAAAGWSSVSFLLHLDYPSLLSYTLPLSRVLLVVFMWMSVTYYFFVRVFVQRRPGPGVYLGVAGVSLVAALAGAGVLPRDAYATGGVLFMDAGPFFLLLAAMALSLGVAAAVLLLQHRRELTTPTARTRVNYLLIGLVVLALGGLSNFSESMMKYPIDQVSNLANAALISYAIQRHRLLEVRFILRRGLAYSSLTVAVTALYLLALFLVQNLLQVSVGYPSLLFASGLALVIAVLFTPLRYIAQERVDRIMFRNVYGYRQILRDFSQGIANTLDLSQLARSMINPIVGAMKARWVALLLPQPVSGDYRAQFSHHQDSEEPGELTLQRDNPLINWLTREGQVLRAEMLHVVPEAKGLWQAEQDGLSAQGVELLCPILSQGKLTGILALGPKETETPYNDEEIELLMTMANGATVALDNARMLAELRQQQSRHEKLLVRAITAQEEERGRVAVELHDSVAQWLVRASDQVQTASALLPTEGEAAKIQGDLASIEDTIDACIKELRRVLAGLRPPALEELGLGHAVSQDLKALEDEGVVSHLEVVGTPSRLPPTVEIAAYRIVQEALNNLRKHARASQVQVWLRFQDKELNIEIADNGQGFDVARTLDSAVSVGNMGLLGMRERASWLGGTVKMHSQPGAGTRLEIRLPTAPPQEAAEEVAWHPSA
ncbi:MAG: GAF domain-containing sensor histidine kinase [Dehalococcoidia bacterium]